MTNQITGTCHCGSIKYEITGKPRSIVNCHCDSCKKRKGVAFSTYVAVSEEYLIVTEGENNLKKYVVHDEGEKHFCSVRGSPIYNKNYSYPGLLMLYYGAIHDNSKIKPMFNVFCEKQVSWLSDINKLKSFEHGIEK